MRAYYRANREKFYQDTDDQILGELARHHNFSLEITQKGAWLQQIEILRNIMKNIVEFELFFEFSIPRMGKRADVVLVIGDLVFVIEFKVGSYTYERYAIEQVEDYALDLKNFHEGSHGLLIYPILIPTNATLSLNVQLELALDQVAKPLLLSKYDAGEIIATIASTWAKAEFDMEVWAASGYRPTPTIIEAARSLYANHDVRDITRYDSGAVNLTKTQEAISRIIENSRTRNEKSVCFITGVPGAGKTLAGLNVATQRRNADKNEHATFLSGNGPLVDVLREALARDQHEREGGTKDNAKRKVNNFIQNIHKFRDEYAHNANAPSDHVVIFDEAQRAWTKAQASKFMQSKRNIADFDMSEPEFLLSVMDRHKDWCTVVCLVGGGQEINVGEAGLSEWMAAIRHKFTHWNIYSSDQITQSDYDLNSDAREFISQDNVNLEADLHLNVSMRSFRAESLSNFVSQMLNNDSKTAKATHEKIKDNYPIYLTRNIETARRWLKSKARGTERFGLIASSGANRLRPEGINLDAPIKPANWFLNERTDVRSSFYLEEVASEFDVQGLELDWTCVCWDANLRYENSQWAFYDFKGTKWQNVNDKFRRLYLKNAYRVLLTRARQGMVLFVPKGDDADPTRPCAFYDQTFEFLTDCGVVELR